MTDPNTELTRLFKTNEAPVRDFDFELKVATAVQRQRLMRDAFDWVLTGLVAATALWAGFPWLFQVARAVFSALGASAPVVIAVGGTGLALTVAWLLPDAFELAPPRD